MPKLLHDARPEILFARHLESLALIVRDLHHDNVHGVGGLDVEGRLAQLEREGAESLKAIQAQLDAEFEGGTDGCHD